MRRKPEIPARAYTPFADGAVSDEHEAFLLRIAMNHGKFSPSDFKPAIHLEANHEQLILTQEEVLRILEAIERGEPVSQEVAKYALLHNPRVSKYIPDKGHWCAKNKD